MLDLTLYETKIVKACLEHCTKEMSDSDTFKEQVLYVLDKIEKQISEVQDSGIV